MNDIIKVLKKENIKYSCDKDNIVITINDRTINIEYRDNLYIVDDSILLHTECYIFESELNLLNFIKSII